jgi:hypothetical protein
MLQHGPRQAEDIVSRRKFFHQAGASALGASAALTLGRFGVAGEVPANENAPKRAPTPLIHETDLFRPHEDPDDHFDLACVYALAQRGDVNLQGVLGDFPPPGHRGDPDVAAVAMLNRLTGLAAPFVVGTALRPASPQDTFRSSPACELGGVNWLLKRLRESPAPVAISIAGSSKDVALATRREPALFAKKCRGIYLNAGTGDPNPSPQAQREYNVALDPFAYATIFAAPCPVYWLPCFERLGPGGTFSPVPTRHGTYYQFRMGEVLAQLAPPVQRFFLSMLDEEPATGWLRSTRAPVDAGRLAVWSAQMRNMWCTAGFLHCAGLTVTAEGTIVPVDRQPHNAVYRFAPVEVACDAEGRTRWRYGSANPPRWKFEVTDTQHYAAAMTQALGALLKPLGRDCSAKNS